MKILRETNAVTAANIKMRLNLTAMCESSNVKKKCQMFENERQNRIFKVKKVKIKFHRGHLICLPLYFTSSGPSHVKLS